MKFTKITSRFILLLILLTLALLCFLLFVIPLMAGNMTLTQNYTDGNAIAFAVFLYLGDLAAITFMASLFSIMRSVSAGDPFLKKNVRLLRSLAICCLIAFSDFAALILIYRNFDCFGLIICAAILLFGTLCAFVLSQVFARAVAYKSENDLTI